MATNLDIKPYLSSGYFYINILLFKGVGIENALIWMIGDVAITWFFYTFIFCSYD